MKTTSFENFPWWMISVSNSVGFAVYGIGLYLMSRVGMEWGMFYAIYCLWMEWRVLSGSCRNCYYYAKRCGFGKGMICSWFFERGAERNLSEKKITWPDIVPDFLVSIVPLAAGIVLIIREFTWLMLFLVVLLGFLGTAGTGFVRGQIVCKYCKQRELGCPAEKLFSKSKTA